MLETPEDCTNFYTTITTAMIKDFRAITGYGMEESKRILKTSLSEDELRLLKDQRRYKTWCIGG